MPVIRRGKICTIASSPEIDTENFPLTGKRKRQDVCYINSLCSSSTLRTPTKRRAANSPNLKSAKTRPSSEECKICTNNPFYPQKGSRTSCGSSDHFLSPERLRTNARHHLDVDVNDVIDRRFHVLKVLGKGGFGKVYCVRDLQNKTGKNHQFALKIYKDTDEARLDMKHEIKVLRHLAKIDSNSANLFVKMHHDFTYYDHPTIVMEKLECSVAEFLKMNKFAPCFDHDQIRKISLQVCKAVRFLHRNKIVHMDVKPHNIAFRTAPQKLSRDEIAKTGLKFSMSNVDVCLVDFGSLVFLTNPQEELTMTTGYSAPEVVADMENYSCDYSADVWSIGCLLFELYVGKNLFDDAKDTVNQMVITEIILGKIPSALRKKIGIDDWDLSRPARIEKRYDSLSKYMRDRNSDTKLLFQLMKLLFEFDAKKRIKLTEAMKHEYFG